VDAAKRRLTLLQIPNPASLRGVIEKLRWLCLNCNVTQRDTQGLGHAFAVGLVCFQAVADMALGSRVQ